MGPGPGDQRPAGWRPGTDILSFTSSIIVTELMLVGCKFVAKVIVLRKI